MWQETQEIREGQSLNPPFFHSSSPTNPILLFADSIPARCWIQVPSSKITPPLTLFPTPTTLATVTIPRMLRYVWRRPSNGTTCSSYQSVDSMSTMSPHPRSLPRFSSGPALILLRPALMAPTALNSVLPHQDPSKMTTTTLAAVLRRSRMT